MTGCGRKIGPYDCCTVVCGDCLELIKALPDGCMDAVITDPPWGNSTVCNAQRFTRRSSSWWAETGHSKVRVHSDIYGDDIEFDPRPFIKQKAILWGANHFTRHLPHSGGWLIWDKRKGAEQMAEKGWPLGEAELAWSNVLGATRVFRNLWVGLLRSEQQHEFYHPTQKPIGLMEWCIVQAGMPETILTPFSVPAQPPWPRRNLGGISLGSRSTPTIARLPKTALRWSRCSRRCLRRSPNRWSWHEAIENRRFEA